MLLLRHQSDVMNSRRLMSAPSSGDGIVSAQTSTLIGAETGFGMQHDLLADVRFGSKADMGPRISDVCFTPESGRQAAGLQCPLSANSGHRSIGCLYLLGHLNRQRDEERRTLPELRFDPNPSAVHLDDPL